MAFAKNIAVGISADSTKFNKGIKDAQSSLASFASTAAMGAAGVAAFAAGLGVAAVAGIASLTSAAFDSVSAQVDLANRLEINVERLRELSFASSQAGGSAEGFTTALEKMNQNVGQAASGSKSDIKAFENLGLSIDEIADNDAVKNFELISQKLAEIESPARRAAAATEIFGKSGGKDVLLMAGSITEASERFKLLSGELSAFDASMIEMAGDSFAELKVILTAIGEQVAAQISPAIVYAVDLMVEFGITGENAANIIAQAFAATKSVINDAVKGFQMARVAMMAYQLDFKGAQELAARIDKGEFDNTGNDFFKNAAAHSKKKLGDTGKPAAFGDEFMERYLLNQKEEKEKLVKAASFEDMTVGDDGDAFMDKFVEDFQMNQKRLEEIANKWKDTIKSPADELKQSLADIKEAFINKTLTAEEAKAADDAATKSFMDAQKDTTKTTGTGMFQTFDTSRVNVEALSRAKTETQTVKDPEAIKVMQGIRTDLAKKNNTQGGVVTA